MKSKLELNLEKMARLMKRARLDAGFTQKELAVKLEVTADTIARWERIGDALIHKLDKWFFECGRRVNISFTAQKRKLIPKDEICSQCEVRVTCTARHEVGLMHSKSNDLVEEDSKMVGLGMSFEGEVPDGCLYMVEQLVNQ